MGKSDGDGSEDGNEGFKGNGNGKALELLKKKIFAITLRLTEN